MVPFLLALTLTNSPSYDPGSIEPDFKAVTHDLTWRDESRDRNVPVKVFLPAAKGPAPVVLFSHGLGGSRNMNGFLGQHLAGRGYVAVFVQHPGSDDLVWRNTAARERLAAMKRAANAENFLLRNADIKYVIDELDRRSKSEGPIKGRVNLSQVGMSGHSFGANTTQAVSGQVFPMIGAKYTDKRIKAAVMYSPNSVGESRNKQAFGSVNIPWLLMTGTEDTSIINDTTVADRLAVFPALPPGQKYELVLFGAEHSAFTEGSLAGDRNRKNPNHHRAMLGITTAFFDAYLKGDSVAKSWLNGEGAKRILEPKDTWKKK